MDKQKSVIRTDTDSGTVNPPLASIFLGPHAENAQYWQDAFVTIFQDYVYWRKNYYPKDGNIMSSADYRKTDMFYREFSLYLEKMLNDLKQSFPFYSPRYMAHMLSEQSLPAVTGYYAAMLYNPNNCTEEAAPVTVMKELEFGKRICRMLGFGDRGWAHLCSGGSAANLEALWAARQSQFFPLVLRDICEKNRWDFRIKLPDFSVTNKTAVLRSCTDRQLLHLHPTESMYMLANLSDYLREVRGMPYEKIMDIITDGAARSEYNIRTCGFANVIAKVGLKPVIFVSQSAHYSLKKAVNILGYGEGSIRPIPTTEKFRIDVDALERMLCELKDDEYIAAVVTVFGTTEEGAVDPVHRVKWLRDSFAVSAGLSFWLHVDAAWGGYFAVMKNEEPLCDTNEGSQTSNFFDRVDNYIGRMNVSEHYQIAFDAEFPEYTYSYRKNKLASWNDREVFAAMFALEAADSITVDPHKMGYVPYPAGVVAFKNKRIVYLLKQHASYIGTDSDALDGTGGHSSGDFDMNFYRKSDKFSIPQVGAYTLEGSRPGAAAMACWFASEVVPLDVHNHGKIIRTTVLNARRFSHYLQQHSRRTFMYVDCKLQHESTDLAPCRVPFTIELLYNNIDTNLVCFFVRPCIWVESGIKNSSGDKFPQMEVDRSWNLAEINEINKKIHERLTISPSREADRRKNSLYQKFYVAATTFDTSMYSAASMTKTLDRFGFSVEEYKKCGLHIMRSTIMNPWYYKALTSDSHSDYFMQFLEELHYAARKVIDSALPAHFERMYPSKHIGEISK